VFVITIASSVFVFVKPVFVFVKPVSVFVKPVFVLVFWKASLHCTSFIPCVQPMLVVGIWYFAISHPMPLSL